MAIIVNTPGIRGLPGALFLPRPTQTRSARLAISGSNGLIFAVCDGGEPMEQLGGGEPHLAPGSGFRSPWTDVSARARQGLETGRFLPPL